MEPLTRTCADATSGVFTEVDHRCLAGAASQNGGHYPSSRTPVKMASQANRRKAELQAIFGEKSRERISAIKGVPLTSIAPSQALCGTKPFE